MEESNRMNVSLWRRRGVPQYSENPDKKTADAAKRDFIGQLLVLIKQSVDLFDDVTPDIPMRTIKVKLSSKRHYTEDIIWEFMENVHYLTNCSIEQVDEETFVLY